MYLPSHICKSLAEGARLTIYSSGIRRSVLFDYRPNFNDACFQADTIEEAVAKLETALRDAEKQT